MNNDSHYTFQLPSRAVFVISLLTVSGVIVALYLSWLHYEVHTNPAFHSFCAMSDAFNCETVAESPYSVFLGVPVSVWGLLGYGFMFILAVVGIWRKRRAGAFLALFTGVMISVIASTILAYLSYCVICSFCLMCSISYGINSALLAIALYYVFRARFSFSRAAVDARKMLLESREILLFLPLFTILLMVLYPKYWVKEEASSSKENLSGMTKEGYHWIGAEKPVLEITEFSDYVCPHCKRAHFFQRQVVSQNPGKIRLIHRHFPLDDACNPLVETPFHPGACLMAQAAACAGKQKKFWEMNDLLFAQSAFFKNRESLTDAARRIGLDVESFRQCLDSQEARGEVRRDIDEGIRRGLSGTPSFIIEDQIHVGIISGTIFKKYGIVKPEESGGSRKK